MLKLLHGVNYVAGFMIDLVEISKSFLPIRVDLTRRHPDQELLLRRYQIRGVPTILFLDSQGTEAKKLRIESYVTKNEVLDRMKQAAGLV